MKTPVCLQTNKVHLFVFFILINCCTPAFSQIKPDESKVAQFAQEVYLNCNEYTTPQHLELYKNHLQAINILKTADVTDIVQLQNISNVALKNKCNSELQYDNAQNFSPQNFNPLKYFFPKSDAPLYYKINETDYIIQVNPL